MIYALICLLILGTLYEFVVITSDQWNLLALMLILVYIVLTPLFWMLLPGLFHNQQQTIEKRKGVIY